MRTCSVHRYLPTVVAVLGLFLLSTSAAAEPTKCRAGIAKASAKFVQTRLKALQGCESKIVGGKLPEATVCRTEAKTAKTLARATTKLRTTVAKVCGGKNKTCAVTDMGKAADDALAAIGWDIGTCPDFESSGAPQCTVPLVDCADIVTCLTCVGEAAVDQAVDLYYRNRIPLGPTTAATKPLLKCQQEIGKTTAKLFTARSKALLRCWEKVNKGKGKATRPCPVPGDGKAQAALAKAKARARDKLCKACGGQGDKVTNATGVKPADGLCDAPGGMFAPTAIGFAATCPALVVPGGEDCGAIGPIEDFQDLLACLVCVTEFKVDCVDRNAVPAVTLGGPYPPECNLEPGPTPTNGVTPVQIETATPVPTTTPSPTATANGPQIVSSPVKSAGTRYLYRYPVEAVDSDVGESLKFTLEAAPEDMSIEEETGVIEWTPSDQQQGEHPVKVVVRDRIGLSDSQSFLVTVGEASNRAPVIVTQPQAEVVLPCGSCGNHPMFPLGRWLINCTINRDQCATSVSFTSSTTGIWQSSRGPGTFTADAPLVSGAHVTLHFDAPGNYASTNECVVERDACSMFCTFADNEGHFGTAGYQWERTLPDTEQAIFGQAEAQFVVGGLDATRGGSFSFVSGVFYDTARNSLATNFPRSSLRSFDTVTDGSLAGVDIAFLAAPKEGSVPITPLSQIEQQALRSFVERGGCAILFADHPPFDGAAESLVDAFGIDVSGGNGGSGTATVINPSEHPTTGGPFGVVSSFRQRAFAALGNLGPFATPLATNSLGTALAVIAPGALGLGSGPVVVFSDANTFIRASTSGFIDESRPLFLNTIDYCVATSSKRVEPYRYDVDAVDPEHDPVAFQISAAPHGMEIDGLTGLVTWQPQAGRHHVVLRADDGRGGTDEQAFELSVTRDLDCDGFTVEAGDCDDASSTSFPGAPETPGNGVDEDCDGVDAPDVRSECNGALRVGFADVVLDYFNSGTGNLPGPYGGTASGSLNNPSVVTDQVSIDVCVATGDEPGPTGFLDYLSLPTNSYVTLGFMDESVVNGPGNDLEIRELFPANEAADVYVSTNGAQFVFVKTITSSTAVIGVDLEGLQLSGPVTAVKIVGKDLIGSSKGFDLGSVRVRPGSMPVGDTDDDGDGFSERRGDCDDTNEGIFPGAVDVPGNGIDEDCTGRDAIPTPTSIAVVPSDATILLGEGRALRAVATFADGSTLDVSNDVQWESDVLDVATVGGDGVALGVSPGVAVITARKDGVAGTATLTVEARVDDTTPPTVAITAPALDTQLRTPTVVIGTADDANFLRYDLELAEENAQVFSTIATGTSPVVDGPLGTLDPTLLPNGVYRVRLTAYDRGGNSNTALTRVSVAGDLKLGNFRVSFADLTIPVAGIPISITRTYDSLDTSPGDFGAGWRLGYPGQVMDSARETPREAFTDFTRVYVTKPDGRRVGFTFTAQCGFFGCAPSFRADPGVFDTLASASEALFKSGGKYYGLFSGTYNPQTYVLTTKEKVKYTLDEISGLQGIEDASGNTLSFTPGGIVSSTGVAVTFERDAAGRITKVTEPVDPASSEPPAFLEYQYDANGNLVRFLDQLTHATKYSYADARFPHYLTKIEDPLGRPVTRSVFNDAGQLIGLCDGNGNPATLKDCTRLTPNPGARLQTVVNARGFRTDLLLDVRGNVLTERRFLDGGTFLDTVRTYDANDNVLAETDPEGNVKSYSYDARGNQLTRTEGGRTTRFTYNTTCNKVETVRNPANVVETTNDYDPTRCNLRFVTNALEHQTEYQYNDPRHPTQVTDFFDANRVHWHWSYDDAGFLEGMTDSLGKTATYRFSRSGDLLSQADRKNQQITFSYDDTHRLRTESWDTTPPRVTTYSYNDAGQLTSAVDPDSSLTLGYEPATGRLASVGNTGTPGAPPVVVTYRYDGNGNVTEVSDSLGGVTMYEYDAIDRLEHIFQSGSGVNEKRVDLTYDGANLLRNLRRFSDLAGTQGVANTTYGYDCGGCADRLKSIHHRKATDGSIIHDLDYVRDPLLPDIRQITDAEGVHTYAYDLTRQLKTAMHPAGGVQPSEFYDYDPAGNRTKSHLSSSYRYVPGTNQLAEDDQDIYVFDDNGALTVSTNKATGAETRYQYDHRGRLIKVSQQTDGTGVPDVTHYRYDAANRRVRIDNGVVSHIVHDGGDVALQLDSSGTVTVRRMNAGGVDNVLAEDNATGEEWLLADQVRSIRDAISNGANVSRHEVYDSFGARVGTSQPLQEGSLTYAGREATSAKGLYYFRARYYDASLGRFGQADPEVPYGYPYVSNGPLTRTDPTGRVTLLEYAQSAGVGAALSVGFSGETCAAAAKKGLAELAACYGLRAAYGAIGGAGGKAVTVTLELSLGAKIATPFFQIFECLHGATLGFALPNGTTGDNFRAGLAGCLGAALPVGP